MLHVNTNLLFIILILLTSFSFFILSNRSQNKICEIGPNSKTEHIHFSILENDNLDFNFAVYKKHDIVSQDIDYIGYWDLNKVSTILTQLEYYRFQNDLERNQVTFIDIGAHIGWFSACLAYLGYNVISIEPMSENKLILEYNICLFNSANQNSNVWSMIGIGVGEKSKTCKLVASSENKGDGNTICNDTLSTFPNYYKERGTVTIDKLDHLLPSDQLNKLNIGLVKIDIENQEKNCLLGGNEFFSSPSINHLIIEFLDKGSEWKEYRENNKFVFDRLRELGFSLSKEGFDRDELYALPQIEFDAYAWKE